GIGGDDVLPTHVRPAALDVGEDVRGADRVEDELWSAATGARQRGLVAGVEPEHLDALADRFAFERGELVGLFLADTFGPFGNPENGGDVGDLLPDRVEGDVRFGRLRAAAERGDVGGDTEFVQCRAVPGGLRV